MASNKKPLVVVTRKLPDSVETRMCELFDTRLNLDDKPMSQTDLAEAVKVADVIVPTVTDQIDRSVLSHSGDRLKLIANFGNGVDNIDVATALQRGITVTNTPGVLTEDTADMTMALILAVPRRLAEGSQVLTGERDWTGWSPTWMLGHRIWGKRLGIVGMGRIGQAVARRAKAFGLQIHYHNRRRVAPRIEEELNATYGRASTRCWSAWTSSRSTSAHARHLSSALGARLKLIRPGGLPSLTYTARGEWIDENAAGAAHRTGRSPPAPACVSEHEPECRRSLRQVSPKRGKRRAFAASRLSHIEGRIDYGREGHRQHQDLHGRPPPARTAFCLRRCL
jgi:glyoxylate reductase